MNYGKVCHNNKQTRFSEYSMQRCVDERNGVGGAIRCNRSALRATIRAVYKSGVLKPCEVERRIRLLNDYYSEAYALPMIVALSFRINTSNAASMRNALLERLCLRKER